MNFSCTASITTLLVDYLSFVETSVEYFFYSFYLAVVSQPGQPTSSHLTPPPRRSPSCQRTSLQSLSSFDKQSDTLPNPNKPEQRPQIRKLRVGIADVDGGVHHPAYNIPRTQSIEGT